MPPFPTKHQTGNESSHDSGFRVYTEVKVEGLGYRRYRRAEFRASRRKRCGRNVEEIVISNTGYRLALCVYLSQPAKTQGPCMRHVKIFESCKHRVWGLSFECQTLKRHQIRFWGFGIVGLRR